MNRWVCIFFLFSFFCSYAATEDSIPDFSKIEGRRQEFISKWYSHITSIGLEPEKVIYLLDQAAQQAQKHQDMISVTHLRFHLGFYRWSHLDQPEGLAVINELLDVFEKEGWTEDWVGAMHAIGMIYLEQGNNVKSLEFQLRAFEAYRNLKPGFDIIKTILASDLANLYYHLGNYAMTLDLLLPVVDQPIRPGPAYDTTYVEYLYLQMRNTVGLAYRQLRKDDSAIYWAQRTLEAAIEQPNNSWVGIANGNIAAVLIIQGNYAKALPYIKVFYECSVREKDPKITAEALIAWADIDNGSGHYDAAVAHLKQAEALFSKDQYYFSADLSKVRKHMYEAFAKAYLHQKDKPNALQYYLKARAIEDSLTYNFDATQVLKIQVQLEAEENIARMREVETNTRISIQRRNFSLIALALAGLFVFALYNRQRLKNRKDKELHQSREQLLYSEKMRAEEQLSGYMENLHEKNRIIEEFETERERLRQLPNSIDKLHTLESIEKLQKSTIITEDEWIEFKALFEKVHKGFFTRLREKYPDATQAEMRLMALTKLKLSTREMANILGISPESMRKARYRFLKKMNDNASGEADMNTIVDSI
jgi:DNA-binding CsgD family transcriptional regulator